MTTKTPATPLPDVGLPWSATGIQLWANGDLIASFQPGLSILDEYDPDLQALREARCAMSAHAANAYPKLVERLNEILAYQPEDEKTAALLRSLGEDA